MLYDLMSRHRTEILDQCLRQLKDQYPERSETELIESLPSFVDQVIDRLRHDRAQPSDGGQSGGSADSTTVKHGLERKRQGFEIGSVVRDYALICEVVSGLAIEYGETPAPREFQLLTRCVDEAIASAVESYRVEERSFEARERAEYLGQLAHELRNAISTALIGFDLVQKGRVAIDGRTGEVVRRALRRSTQLINQTLAEARLSSGVTVERQRLGVAGLFAEVAAGAFPEREIALDLDVAPDLEVVGDPRLLLSTLSNLVQNAIKFSGDQQRVVLRARAAGDLVNMEIEDRCGGLPEGVCERMFKPFMQHSADLRGVGLGLAIARRAVEAHGGTIGVRNLPGVGCVFSVWIPNGV
jgi:signal transduction histidine kinase